MVYLIYPVAEGKRKSLSEDRMATLLKVESRCPLLSLRVVKNTLTAHSNMAPGSA